MIGILLEAATFQFCMSQERDVVSCHVRCFYISCFPLFFLEILANTTKTTTRRRDL